LALLQEIISALRIGLEGVLEAWLDQAQMILSWLVWVAFASAAGGATRFLVSGLVARGIGETFPWGTVVVNATGAFAIGALAAAADSQVIADGSLVWPAAVTGFLGSYTTVSSFSLQTLSLVRDGAWARAGGNVLLSLLLCLSAVALGFVSTTVVLGGSPA
jgi:CrcB protein